MEKAFERAFKDENFSQYLENEIAGQVEYSLLKEFNQNFDRSVTPSFEKYLASIFDQIANTFDEGF